MAMEIPVVTTSRAANGIISEQENHLKIADYPNDFASKVSLLLRDKSSRKQIGLSARKFVKTNYNWEINMNKLNELLHKG